MLSVVSQDDDTNEPNRCHENCRKGTDFLVQCDTNGYQASGCDKNYCNVGFEVARGPMICHRDPSDQGIMGKLFLEPKMIPDFNSTNQKCSNITSLFDMENT